MNNRRTVKLDLDGVLVNMSLAIATSVNKVLDSTIITDDNKFGITRNDFDSVIKNVDYKWWENLEKYKWSDALINLVHTQTKGNWCFLTKSSKSPQCFYGKALWIEKHYPMFSDRLIVTRPDKSKSCTGKNDLLIDDYELNIERWNKVGISYKWVEVTNDCPSEEIKRRFIEISNLIRNE